MEVSWIYTVCAVDEEPGPGEDSVPVQPFEKSMHAWSYQRQRPSCVAHEGVFHKVIVRQLSGESLEITLSETATIIDVKASVQVSWDVACAAQRMVLGEVVVENDETLSSLHDGSALHLTVVVDAAQLYADLLERIHYERRQATNTKSMAQLHALVLRIDDLEQAMSERER